MRNKMDQLGDQRNQDLHLSAAAALWNVNTTHTVYKRSQTYTNTDQGCNDGAVQPVEPS